MYYTGFLTVENIPSPKFHLNEVGYPAPLSLNVNLIGAIKEVLNTEKAGAGALKFLSNVVRSC